MLSFISVVIQFVMVMFIRIYYKHTKFQFVWMVDVYNVSVTTFYRIDTDFQNSKN